MASSIALETQAQELERAHVRPLVNSISATYARYCPAVMRTLTQALLAALKSLARRTAFLHRSLTTWYIRIVAAKSLQTHSPLDSGKSLELFAEEVERLLGAVLDTGSLSRLSAGLQTQFKDALKEDMSCMLPSYNHQLPQGSECGTFLALDVGGSTFRVALIQLSGPGENDSGMKILSLKAYKINDPIKQLVGVSFFDWMAGKIEETISGHSSYLAMDGVLSAGLAWSFPIEQTSLRSGMLQGMGKGFMAAHGVLGQDLGDLIQAACSRKNIKVHISAIVNDSTATLLSKAYTSPSTRYGLILGTGLNIALLLPTTALLPSKYGIRPSSWHSAASHVIVNTELGMFGRRGLLPRTRWDEELNATHILPDFQPLELLTSGRYLGEIARLIMMDGIRTAGMFGGVVPGGLERPYNLETETLAGIEGAKTTQEARVIFTTQHPSPYYPSDTDIRTLRLLISDISKRSSALIAASIHALWQLRLDSSAPPALSSLDSDPSTCSELTNGNGDINGHVNGEATNAYTKSKTNVKLHETARERTVVACNGSVIEKYPGFRASCQAYLDQLIEVSGGERGAVELVVANESSLRGAAVAVAVSVSG